MKTNPLDNTQKTITRIDIGSPYRLFTQKKVIALKSPCDLTFRYDKNTVIPKVRTYIAETERAIVVRVTKKPVVSKNKMTVRVRLVIGGAIVLFRDDTLNSIKFISGQTH